ncbi:MAG: hypothetical protein HS131_02015 [Ignavibacteriales bacterium]|nr:hypothetical protein [Ignavibacteriales bacterium]
MVFSVEGGTTLASTDYSGLGVDYLGRLSIEYFFPARTKSGFGIRAFYNAVFLQAVIQILILIDFRTNISTIGAG